MTANLDELLDERRQGNVEIISLLREIRDTYTDRKKHKEEHEFLRELIEKERANKELRQAVKTKIFGTGIVSGVGILLLGIGLVLKDWLIVL